MIKKLFIICSIIIVATPAAETHAGNAPSHPVAPKRVNIIVHQLSPIAFGTFASSASGGTITIDAASGARIVSGAINVLNSGDYGQAEFAITGQPGEEIIVTPPASATLAATGNSGDMVISDFKVVPAEIMTLDRQGNAKVKIGGVLKVPGNISQGSYSGFVNITARYTH